MKNRIIDLWIVRLMGSLIVVLGLTNVQAKDGRLQPLETYDGGVTVERVSGTIELRDGAAPLIQLDADVSNRSDKSASVVFGFRSSQADLATTSLTAQARRTIRMSAKGELEGKAGSTQQVKVDLTMLMDGRLPNRPVSEVNIRVLLPVNSPGLVRTSANLTHKVEAGRSVYYLRQSNSYLGRLAFVYTTGPVTLELRKVVTPTPIAAAGPVDVLLTIKNLGPRDAQNVHIEDNYDPRDFEASGSGFFEYAGQANDRRLIWSTDIPMIRAGESVDVRIGLKAKGRVRNTDLSAAFARINNQLVGVSNKISLPK